VGKGYAEGPAAEAAEARLDALVRGEADAPRAETRAAVYGATGDNPEKHFLDWADDVDADTLFASGGAWGISIVHRSTAP
jgi:hypothetical protein